MSAGYQTGVNQYGVILGAADNAIATLTGGTANKILTSGGAGANPTWESSLSGITQLNVDNLRLDGNTISSTDTDGNIILSPDGTGGVVIPTNLTVGESAQDIAFTINGSAINAIAALHASGTTDLGGFVEERHSETAALGAHNLMLRSRGVEGAATVVQDGDILGRIISCGYDGTDFAQSVEIRTSVDGTPGSNDMPGKLEILTSADGGQTPTLALTIDSSQMSTFTGTLDVIHTATESDDHALEIDCDAAGFGDVKAIDIVYITGAMTAVQDEEAILLNIDESASVGGILNGYEVLTTAEGSATINGYTTGINVNPVVHESGTFGDADNILNKLVDVTAALASGGAGSISIFVADDDTITIGDAATWDEFEIILATGASGSGVAPTYEYSTGGASYSPFSPADGTNGFRNTGAILWDSASLAGWATATSGRYEILITRTRNSLSTTPIIDELQISSTTEYSWDKNGDVTVKSISLTDDLIVADGGTGASTLTGVLTGNGTSAVTANAITQYGVVIGGASNAVASTAVGTAAQVLTSNGAGVAPTFQAAAGGGGLSWNSITSGSLTGAALTVTSGLGTAYDEYFFVITGASATGTFNIQAEISDNGGSTYAVAVRGMRASSGDTVDILTALPIDTNDAAFELGDTAELLLYIRGNKLANYKTMEWNVSSPGGAAGENGWGNVNVLTTADIDAVKISLDAGTYDAGTYVVYGR